MSTSDEPAIATTNGGYAKGGHDPERDEMVKLNERVQLARGAALLAFYATKARANTQELRISDDDDDEEE